MLKDVVAAKPLTPYQIHLRFEDGVEGTIDLSQLIEFTGVFMPLQDPAYFATVKVHPELGTIGITEQISIRWYFTLSF